MTVIQSRMKSIIRNKQFARVVFRFRNWLQTLYGISILCKPFLIFLLFSHILNLINVIVQMIRPQYWGGMIDIVTRSQNSQEFQEAVVGMIIYYLTSSITGRIQSKVKGMISRSLSTQLKTKFQKIILEKDMEFFDVTPQADVTSILTSGANDVQNLLTNYLIGPLEAVLSLCGTLMLIYNISSKLTLMMLLLIPIRTVTGYISYTADQVLMERFRVLMNEMYNVPFSLVQNIFMIKLFSTEDKELKDFTSKAEEIRQIEDKIDQKTWNSNFLRGLVDQLIQLAMLWYGGMMVFDNEITAGDLSKFNMYATSLVITSSLLQSNINNLVQSLQTNERLLSIINHKCKINQDESDGLKKEIKGSINIKDVSFCYPTKQNVEVLKNINLKIDEGESVAFVGQNGSGKTTLSYLIQRLYDPTNGRITIDDNDLKEYDTKWIHQRIGYVSQEPVLLNKTVEENIVYGLDSFTNEQIQRALEISNSEFILDKNRFPDGLKTKVGVNGVKLSGGEKQRIAIARALARNPKILILDEPTSALDGESEVQVQNAINNLMNSGNMTIIVIAHKLSSIKNCNKIYLFDQGRIMEQGSHKELLATENLYTRLFRNQISSAV